MRDRSAVAVALVLAVCAPLAWAFGTGSEPSPPAPVAPAAPPPLALLEGAPDAPESAVVVRHGNDRAAVLGRVAHVAGSARRGVVLRGGADPVALVVAQERPARGASTYDSALYRVDARGTRRLLGGLTNASRPLVTAAGTVIVQRGADGEERPLIDRQLRERRDPLTLDAVDPDTGAVRTVWRGEGQLAFLACALNGDSFLAYHLDDQTAALRVLDASSGAVRTLREGLHLARDFSYDRARDAVVFAQATGPAGYRVASLSLRDGSLRTLYAAQSDHLMPFALADGRVALSLPDDRGAGLLTAGSDTPRAVAPLGAGSDAVLAERAGWIALRHTEIDRERTALMHLATGAVTALDGDGVVREVLGFVGAP